MKCSTGVLLIQLFFFLDGKDVVLVKVLMEQRQIGMSRPRAVHLFLQLFQPIGTSRCHVAGALRSHAD